MYSRLLTELDMLVFFIKLGISGQIFGLISSFLSYKWLQVVLNGKSSQEYPVNAGVLQGFILSPALSLLHINDLPNDVICNIVIYSDDTTLFSKCDQTSDLWQQIRIGSWTWIWSTRHCGLDQDTVCWFQYWKISTNFVWPL